MSRLFWSRREKVSSKKEAPLSDRLRQGQTKKDDFLDVYSDYITKVGFFEGWQMWQTESPALELRRAAR